MIDPLVIVLEDDAELRSFVDRGLREEGFEVSTAGTAAELVRQMDAGEPTRWWSTSGCPTPTAATSCRRCGRTGSVRRCIFLTARDALPDRLSGFAPAATTT